MVLTYKAHEALLACKNMSASVLLKPIFNGNERCHTTERNSSLQINVNSIPSMILGDQ